MDQALVRSGSVLVPAEVDALVRSEDSLGRSGDSLERSGDSLARSGSVLVPAEVDALVRPGPGGAGVRQHAPGAEGAPGRAPPRPQQRQPQQPAGGGGAVFGEGGGGGGGQGLGLGPSLGLGLGLGPSLGIGLGQQGQGQGQGAPDGFRPPRLRMLSNPGTLSNPGGSRAAMPRYNDKRQSYKFSDRGALTLKNFGIRIGRDGLKDYSEEVLSPTGHNGNGTVGPFFSSSGGGGELLVSSGSCCCR